ncbi:MAG: CGNR zinc finger domain-containing protein [Mycobacterium sp.]|nr:CGNR zinc finger domain-containing protein [Mycobacterium sp.]
MSEPAVGWLGDAEAKPAPEPLTRIQALINTVDLESGADRLADAAAARPWLVAHGLLAADRTPSADDLATVRAVREALRAMVVHNAGGPLPSAADLAPLRRIADTATARARLDDDGTVRVDPVADAQAGRLLALLLVVAEAQRDGTWQHLKACGNEDCRWAFYDRSRNHGGTWCDMATCGNKLKNREFRARRNRVAR